jgi:gliding motility-associated-like protein
LHPQGNNGTAPYTYSIDGGATYSSTDVYTVNVKGVYGIYVKDSQGCTSYNEIEVLDDYEAPVITLSPAGPYHIDCINPSVSVAMTTSDPGKTQYLYWQDGSQASPRTFTNGVSSYKVTARGYNGCTATETITITEDKTPATVEIVSAGTILNCNTGSIVLTANASPANSAYIWSTGETTSSITVSTAGNYSVTVTAPSGCTGTASQVITSEVMPVLSLTSSGTTVSCAIPQVLVSTSATGGRAPYQYSLNGGTYQSGNVFTITSGGTYTLYVKDASGCIASQSITISEDKALPITTITASGTQLTCSVPYVTLSVPSAAGASYKWSTGATSQSIIVSTAGTYNVTVTGANGCTNTSNNITITEAGKPALNVTPESATITCLQPNVTIQATATGGTAPYSYSLNGGAEQASGTFTLTSGGSYVVTLTDANGCTQSKAVSVIQNNTVPTLGTISPKTGCDDAGVSIEQAAISGFTYNYYQTDGTTTLSNPARVTISGTYYVSLMNNTTGCESPKQAVVVNIVPKPIITNTVVHPECSGGMGSISITSGSMSNIHLINGNTVPSNNPLPYPAGTHQLQVVTPEGCVSEETVTLLPGKTIPALTVADYIACAEPGMKNISDLIDPSSLTGTLKVEGGVSGFDTDAVGKTSYWVSQTDGTCESERSELTVEIKPQVTFDLMPAEANIAICAGSTVELIVSNYPPDGEITWSNTNSKASMQRLTLNESTDITATVSNGYCSTSRTRTITVQNSFKVTVPDELTLCSGQEGELYASGGESYLWTPETGLSDATLSNPTVLVDKATMYTVRITNGNCVETRRVLVKTAEAPVITNISEQMNGELTVSVEGGKAPYSYSVDGGAYMNRQELSKYAIEGLESETYYNIEVSDANSCTSDSLYLYKGYKITIPMYFTPNRDGEHDRWEIGGIDKFPTAEIIIYDRFGKELIKYNGAAQGWDGFYLNKLMPSTDYWYLIIMPDGSKLKGHFTLINH